MYDDEEAVACLADRRSCLACPYMLERRPLFQIVKDAGTNERRIDWALFRRRCACTLVKVGCGSPFNRSPLEQRNGRVSVEGMICRVIPSWLVR